MKDISASEVCIVPFITSLPINLYHLKRYAYDGAAVCLFVRIVGSSHLKLSAKGQSAKQKFSVLVHKSPSGTIRIVAPQPQRQSYEWKCKQKLLLDKSKGKVKLEVFFNVQGLVGYDSFQKGAL